MKIQDIHDYFNQKNRRNLALEEIAALFAYLLVIEGSVTAQDVLAAASQNGYYSTNTTNLYRVTQFFEANNLCVSTFRKRELGRGKRCTGRPVKVFSLPNDLHLRRIVYSMVCYWPQMPGNQNKVVKIKRKRLKRVIANYEAFAPLRRAVYSVSR